MLKRIKVWIECMRLRTLPVSLSGVVIAIFWARYMEEFRLTPAILCVAFALMAQVVSNFANEYYDYLRGTDKAGREGPRRGVTEGDISPRTLLIATYSLLAVTAAVGCCLIFYGGWWLLPVGIVIALAALAYSAGPYPLSYHAMGELMVFIFFGLVPVNFTFYVVAGRFSMGALFLSVAIAFMAVNVLLVNNYRDMEDDREAGKITATVRVGRTATLVAYFFNGVAAMLVMAPFWVLAQNTRYLSPLTLCALPIYLIIHSTITLLMHQWRGHKLNPLLGLTALNMLLFTIIISAMFELCRGSGFSW